MKRKTGVKFVSVKKIHIPKLGAHVFLTWGDEAFTEMNFTPLFLFITYDDYVATVFIKRVRLCLYFKTFNTIFPRLIAV